MSVNDIFKGTGTIPCLSGRVETGFINVSKKVMVQPQGEVATIKGNHYILKFNSYVYKYLR